MNDKNYCTLYIVRHGETDWNVAKRIQGHTDIDLNTEGEKQAKALGDEFKDVDFDAVFSSDLVRAKRTAEIIVLEKKLAVKTTELLRERKFGRFEGQPSDCFKEMAEIFDKLTDQERFSSNYFPDVENDEEIISRFTTFAREACVAYPGKKILFTTHGGILRSLLVHLGFANYKDHLHVGNTAYMILKSDGVDFFIQEIKGIEKNN